MSECMAFPNTAGEFIEQYSFTDSKQEYTNGAELIPVFRVKQMMEHYFATDNNVGGKWIPVTERLPEVDITHNNRWEKSTESVHVLCYCKQKSGKRMVKEGSCKVYASGTTYWMIPGTIDSVTHWMPLPQAPKGEM